MVTKHTLYQIAFEFRLILAKIHMVTKPQIHVTIYLKTIKYVVLLIRYRYIKFIFYIIYYRLLCLL